MSNKKMVKAIMEGDAKSLEEAISEVQGDTTNPEPAEVGVKRSNTKGQKNSQ